MVSPLTIAASSSGGSSFFLIIIVVFFLLWLFLIRPQRRRQSQQQQMLRDVHVGDEVLTAGGIYGTISRLDEDEVTVQIAPRVEVRVARRAIASVLTEHEEPEGPEEPQEKSGDQWRSVFDEEDADGGASDEENPG